MNNVGKEGLPAELEIQTLVPKVGNEEHPILCAIVLTSAPKFPFNFVFETTDYTLVSQLSLELASISDQMRSHPANVPLAGKHVGSDNATDN